jgi:hypothetical protein
VNTGLCPTSLLLPALLGPFGGHSCLQDDTAPIIHRKVVILPSCVLRGIPAAGNLRSATMEIRSLLARLLFTLQLVAPCLADGSGFIGYGKVMHFPACAHACRGAVALSPLPCTPEYGPFDYLHGNNPTSPDCFATSEVFMQTVALCIATHCPKDLSLDTIESYWRLHETSGNVPESEPKPAMSYSEALASIGQRPNVTMIPTRPLNKTSLVSLAFFQGQLNAVVFVEQAEISHSKYRYARSCTNLVCYVPR